MINECFKYRQLFMITRLQSNEGNFSGTRKTTKLPLFMHGRYAVLALTIMIFAYNVNIFRIR